MDAASLAQFLDAAVKLSVPLLFAGLGELLTERAGIINIGVEGVMLTAAFFGFWTALATDSAWLGIAAGAASATAMAALFGAWAIHRRADQIVAGTAINLLAFGLTGALYRGAFGETGSALTVRVLPSLALPGLSKLPVFGPLFDQNALAYLAFLFTPLVAFWLYRTGAGLSLRAVGEEPRAAEAAGVSVERMQWVALLAGGALAGLGGAFLSLGHANTFTEGMTAGRGFIALAIVIFGRWQPWGVLGASLFFGAATALQFALQSQGYGVSYQFFLALPYVATLIALTLFAGRRRGGALFMGQEF